MEFSYDIHKALAAVGYLCARNKGSWNVLHLVKAVYAADKAALIKWHRSITGDSLYSLWWGPIVSETYDLMKGKGKKRNKEIWDRYVKERKGNIISLKIMPDQEYLSQREIDLLEAAYKKVSSMSEAQLKKWTHDFPEYEKPSGKSGHKRINPSKILSSYTLLTKEQIASVEEEIASVNYAGSVFHGS